MNWNSNLLNQQLSAIGTPTNSMVTGAPSMQTGQSVNNYLSSLSSYMGAPTLSASAGSLPAVSTGFDWKSLLDPNGLGGLAFDGAKTAGGLYFGMKNYGMAQDQLEENQRQFDLNYGAQKKAYNMRVADRANARYASNPNGYASPSEYIKKHEVA